MDIPFFDFSHPTFVSFFRIKNDKTSHINYILIMLLGLQKTAKDSFYDQFNDFCLNIGMEKVPQY